MSPPEIGSPPAGEPMIPPLTEFTDVCIGVMGETPPGGPGRLPPASTNPLIVHRTPMPTLRAEPINVDLEEDSSGIEEEEPYLEKILNDPRSVAPRRSQNTKRASRVSYVPCASPPATPCKLRRGSYHSAAWERSGMSLSGGCNLSPDAHASRGRGDSLITHGDVELNPVPKSGPCAIDGGLDAELLLTAGHGRWREWHPYTGSIGHPAPAGERPLPAAHESFLLWVHGPESCRQLCRIQGVHHFLSHACLDPRTNRRHLFVCPLCEHIVNGTPRMFRRHLFRCIDDSSSEDGSFPQTGHLLPRCPSDQSQALLPGATRPSHRPVPASYVCVTSTPPRRLRQTYLPPWNCSPRTGRGDALLSMGDVEGNPGPRAPSAVSLLPCRDTYAAGVAHDPYAPVARDACVHDSEYLSDRRTCHRMRQIAFGKATVGYYRYRCLVPVLERLPGFPVTPRVDDPSHTRSWRSKLHAWRRALHEWDDAPIAPTSRGGFLSCGDVSPNPGPPSRAARR